MLRERSADQLTQKSSCTNEKRKNVPVYWSKRKEKEKCLLAIKAGRQKRQNSSYIDQFQGNKEEVFRKAIYKMLAL